MSNPYIPFSPLWPGVKIPPPSGNSTPAESQLTASTPCQHTHHLQKSFGRVFRQIFLGLGRRFGFRTTFITPIRCIGTIGILARRRRRWVTPVIPVLAVASGCWFGTAFIGSVICVRPVRILGRWGRRLVTSVIPIVAIVAVARSRFSGRISFLFRTRCFRSPLVAAVRCVGAVGIFACA